MISQLRGRPGWRGRCTSGVRLPRLRMMGVWRERPLVGVLHSDTNLALDGGVNAGGPWRLLGRERTRLRRLMQLLRAVSVALLFFVLAIR